MKNIFFLAITVVLFSFSFSASAEQIPASPAETITSAFQKYKEVSVPSIKVPTVVEVSFSEDFTNRFNFAVFDTETKIFQPYYFMETLRTVRTPVSVSVQGDGVNGNKMLDGDTRTFTEFTLPQSEQGQIRLVLASEKLMTLNGMTFFLDQYVALPTSIEIRASTDSGEKIILARSQMHSGFVVFPKTSAKNWVVALTYGQPLRITELVLHEDGVDVVGSRTLRFLAQPEHSYRVYFDADRSVQMSIGEAGNLALDTDVLRLSGIPTQTNMGYVLADTDGDGIPDIRDNCVSNSNSDQADVSVNGRGDVCDDFDKDGIINSLDNCPNDPNYDQSDVDGDKIGDVCDKEESRVTEKYPWLPMAGVGFAGLVLIVLFAITTHSMLKKKTEDAEN